MGSRPGVVGRGTAARRRTAKPVGGHAARRVATRYEKRAECYCAVVTLAAILLSYAIKTSKFGLGLMSIREDEDAAEVMGINTPNYKTWAYVLSAILPGIAGVLFYFKNSSIEPSDAFNLNSSIELLVMVMLGGSGTVLGPVLGAAGYEILRGFLLTSRLFKNIQLTVSGILLLLIILFIPAGAVGWLRRRFPALRKVIL